MSVNTMDNTNVNGRVTSLVLSGMFIALGIVLPFITGEIPQIGNMLCPMHIPVFLCGLICGWPYGIVVGFLLPLLRSVLFGMPPMFPTAIAMSFELASYGFLSGYLYSHSRWQCVIALYRCLIASMLGGRIVWGAVRVVLAGLSGSSFTWAMFMSGAFITAIPGIILQLVMIPAIMVGLNRAGLVRFRKSEQQPAKERAGRL